MINGSTNILTPDVIAMESLRILHNSVQFVRTINRQLDGQFGKEGAKIGDSIRIRVPAQAGINTGAALGTVGAFVETSRFVQLSSNNQIHTQFQFDSRELTLGIDQFSERVAKPAATRLASEIDKRVMQEAILKGGFYVQGSGASNVLAYRDVLRANAQLDRLTTPREDRTFILSSQMQISVADAVTKLFNPSATVSKTFLTGYIGTAANTDWLISNLLPDYAKLPAGTLAATTTVVSMVSGTNSIVLDTTLANGTVIPAGTIFSVKTGTNPINKINPETKTVYAGDVYQFSVPVDTTVAAGQLAITLGYELYNAAAAGNLQNIERLPAAADVVTFFGSESTAYAQGVVYHKDAFTFVTADLMVPSGVDQASRAATDDLSMRYIRQYIIGTDMLPARWDILYAVALLRPEYMCRVICTPEY